MNIEYHLDLLAHSAAHSRELLDGGEHGTVGLEDLALLGQTPAHKAPPHFLSLQARLNEGGGVRAGFRVVGVADNTVAGLPAEELVEGNPESLALNVAQRYVHGRD